MDMYDVMVIGAGPAGTQAAISAAHQMRHVLVLTAGEISQKKGRAYWSKSVMLEDVPVFSGITGPEFIAALYEWMASRPVREIVIGGRRQKAGIEVKDGMVLRATRHPEGFIDIEVSVAPLKGRSVTAVEHVIGRTLVIASGFEDLWPDIEVDEEAERLYQRYRTVFRYAGNRKGWHVCIRCDGHLHVDEHLAIVGVGDYIYPVTVGAQDFTSRMTILTNGRPHGMSSEVLENLHRRGIDIIEEKILAHIGRGTDLLGFRFADGRELFFDGFFVDEGLRANIDYLEGWSLKKDAEGLLVVDEDGQVLDPEGRKVSGLFAAGDVVSGTRKLIATAFASGQNAGLSASDALRVWE
jgi:thioredoxin reductase